MEMGKLVAHIPYFYTTWTMTLAAAVVGAAALRLPVPCGVWRGAFSLFAGACLAGMFWVRWYSKVITQKYGISWTVVWGADLMFHIIPLVALVVGARWLSSRVLPFRGFTTTATMFAVVLAVGLVYLASLGTSMYPGSPVILCMLVVATTSVSMLGISCLT